MADADPIVQLETSLQARWDPDTAAVYADLLASRGDPRGELIAIDLELTRREADQLRERKREIIDAIVANKPTRGPVHAELDLTDRCNVACYFCNQQDLRTKESIALPRLTDLIDELAEGGLKSVRLSGGGELLTNKPVLQRAVKMRSPYVDALSLLQLRALRALRDSSAELSEDETADQRRLLLLTLKGVAAGLQNTG